MSRKKTIKLMSWLALFSMPVLFSFSSCSLSWVDNGKIQIKLPETKTKVVYIGDSGEFSVILTGFSFQSVGNVNLTKLKVKNQFKQPLAIFNSNIVNLDAINKTFDVQIDGVGAVMQKTSGPLIFTYFDKELDSEKDDFTLEFTKETVIEAPIDRVISANINYAGSTIFWIRGFTYSNIDNLKNDLVVTADFAKEGATFTYEIENISLKSFDIKVSIDNASVGTVDGQFTFTYRGEPISRPPLEVFSLIISDVGSIITPSETTATADFHNKTASQTVLHNFRYTGDLKPEFLTVTRQFEDDEQSIKEMQVKPVNWTEETNSFDVQFDIEINSYVDNFPLEKDIRLNFYYKTFPLGHSDVKIDFHYAIPIEWLEIPSDDPTTLNGIKYGCFEKITPSHRWLDVPDNIKKVGGFDDWFNSPIEVNFPLAGPLEIFDKYAFSDQNASYPDPSGQNTTGALVLPANVKTIENSAFEYNHFTSLQLPTLADCEIHGQAFISCSFTGELIIPKNIKKIGLGAFQNCKQLEQLRIISPATELDEATFSGCENLSKVDFSNFTTTPSWFQHGGASGAFQDAGKKHFQETGKKGQIVVTKESRFQGDFTEFKTLLSSVLYFNLDYWEIVEVK